MAKAFTLSDAIADAIGAYYSDPENIGFVSSFLLVAEVMKENGIPSIAVAHPETQSYVQSAGLVALGDEWIRDDIRESFACSFGDPDATGE